MNSFKVTSGLALLLVVLVSSILMACSDEPRTPVVRSDIAVSGATQASVMSRAISAVPAYEPESFPAREDINTYLKETESRDSWYVYALNKEGVPMFYMVSSMQPRNLCTSITSPDRMYYGAVRSSPALDGVYYGGTNCGDTQYMIDINSGNFIQISGSQFTLIASKVPLSLETDPLIFGDK